MCLYSIWIMVGTRSPSQGWASTPRRSLPTFTTVDHHYHREKNRWMLGVEKLASLGFPVRDDISKIYGVDLRKLIIDYILLLHFFGSWFPKFWQWQPEKCGLGHVSSTALQISHTFSAEIRRQWTTMFGRRSTKELGTPNICRSLWLDTLAHAMANCDNLLYCIDDGITVWTRMIHVSRITLSWINVLFLFCDFWGHFSCWVMLQTGSR